MAPAEGAAGLVSMVSSKFSIKGSCLDLFRVRRGDLGRQRLLVASQAGAERQAAFAQYLYLARRGGKCRHRVQVHVQAAQFSVACVFAMFAMAGDTECGGAHERRPFRSAAVG